MWYQKIKRGSKSVPGAWILWTVVFRVCWHGRHRFWSFVLSKAELTRAGATLWLADWPACTVAALVPGLAASLLVWPYRTSVWACYRRFSAPVPGPLNFSLSSAKPVTPTGAAFYGNRCVPSWVSFTYPCCSVAGTGDCTLPAGPDTALPEFNTPE